VAADPCLPKLFVNARKRLFSGRDARVCKHWAGAIGTRRPRSAEVLGRSDVRVGERVGMDPHRTARHPAAPGDGRTPVGCRGLRPPGLEPEPNPPTTSGCTSGGHEWKNGFATNFPAW
jgi:hypothetical protein